MHTIDGVEGNVERIAALFPNCVTEAVDDQGNLRHVVDFDKLKVELGEVVEGPEERYQFTWPGKRDAIRLANSPIAATLRPVREDSVDFDNTQNLYIEGDNLDVLKLLRETYLGKVKMIYIDPPYNTGNDFIYNDNYHKSLVTEERRNGLFDHEGNQTMSNYERNQAANGRFHTDWLNMIYPRLKVARDLLSDEGVIFISIDDKEVSNLLRMGVEIFGETNFVGNIVWQSRTSISNDDEISTNHNHTIVFSKNREKLVFNGEDIDASEYINPDNDPRGPWKLVPLDANHAGGDTVYPVTNPKTGIDFFPPNGRIWCYNQKTMQKLIDDGRIKFGINDDSSPKRKLYYNERMEKGDCKTPSSILLDAGTTKSGTEEIMALFNNTKVFDYPKPSTLIQKLIKYGFIRNEDIVLDFFSGSGTTAQALFQYEVEKSLCAKYILVQIAEDLDWMLNNASSEAKKTITNAIALLDSLGKPHAICEIAKERIRRAGNKVKAGLEQRRDILKQTLDRLYNAKPSATTQLLLMEDIKDAAKEFYKNEIEPKEKELIALEKQIASLDIGFRVLRLDSSNMEDVYYTPDQFDPNAIQGLMDNVKDDRSEEDLLFQVMLELDIPLSASIQQEQIAGKRVFNVADGHLIATFDRDINETTVTEVARRKPNFFVMRDASAANDNVLDNFDQIFRHYSPDTTCKIL